MSMVGGIIGLRIRKKCRGVTRSILLDKDEAAWLTKSYEELVTVKDSKVFWN
jgi:nucleosome binding factor SPN SPT16 subunit